MGKCSIKHIILFIVTASLLNIINWYSVSAEENDSFVALYPGSCKAVVNGEIKDIDYESSKVFPIRKNENIYVPLRFVLEQADANISWLPDLNMVSIKYKNNVSKLAIGSTSAVINGQECVLDRKTELIHNRVFIPLQTLEKIIYDKNVAFISELIVIKNKDSAPANPKDVLAYKSWLKKFEQDDDPLFPVLIDNKLGYINEEGKVVIEPVFSHADDFKEGLALIKYQDKCGFIDKSGKILFTVESLNGYCYSAGFSEGLAGVWDLSWGYDYCTIYDTKGRIVGSKDMGSLIYSDAGGTLGRDYHAKANCYYSDGLIPLRFDYGLGVGCYRFINKEGKSVFNYKFYEAQNFSEGLAAVTGIYDIDDELIRKSESPHELFWEYKGNLRQSGFIDINGDFIIPLNEQYEDAHSFSEGLAAVKVKNKGWGFINKAGEFVIQPGFISVSDFHDGLANVRDNNLKCGYIDKNGNYAIEPIYDQASEFKEGLAEVGKIEWGIGTMWGFINKKGELVIDYKYGNVESFHNGLARVYEPVERETETQRIEVDYNRFTYIDKEGNTVWK